VKFSKNSQDSKHIEKLSTINIKQHGQHSHNCIAFWIVVFFSFPNRSDPIRSDTVINIQV